MNATRRTSKIRGNSTKPLKIYTVLEYICISAKGPTEKLEMALSKILENKNHGYSSTIQTCSISYLLPKLLQAPDTCRSRYQVFSFAKCLSFIHVFPFANIVLFYSWAYFHSPKTPLNLTPSLKPKPQPFTLYNHVLNTFLPPAPYSPVNIPSSFPTKSLSIPPNPPHTPKN